MNKNKLNKFFIIITVVISTMLTNNIVFASNNSASSQPASPASSQPATLINKDGIFIQRDELPLYSSTIQLLSLFITIISIIFGTIVGINVYQGHKIIKDAKEDFNTKKQELDKLLETIKKELIDIQQEKNKYYKSFEKLSAFSKRIYEETKNKIEEEARKNLEEFIINEYGYTTITRYKKQLIDELNKEEPDIKNIFYRLTDIINFPSHDNLGIYHMCIEKFKHDTDIMNIVYKGIKIASTKQFDKKLGQ